MKIFNSDKPKDLSEEKITPDAYESISEERKKELATLKEILRGMRSEVASLMVQIKARSGELEKLNEEKAQVEKDVGKLSENYYELKKSFLEKQDVILFLDKTISEINKEILEASSRPDKLETLKEEYNNLAKQVSEEKLKLFRFKSERQLLLKNTDSYPTNKHFGVQKPTKSKKCAAKTSSGKKCKRTALPEKEYCSMHIKQKAK